MRSNIHMDTIFDSTIDVKMVECLGSDDRIVAAAKVSTLGEETTDEKNVGLIGYLMKNRHGSPFEHGVFTFRVTAPIFVWREHHRHRIASYNEESGRYTQLKPHFYVPGPDRELIQQGKPGAYEFVAGDAQLSSYTQSTIENNSVEAYERYERLLEAGVAKEVARMVLPVNIFSTCYVTMNLRSLMNFLSLRTKSLENSMFKSFPQKEISMVADKYEEFFRGQFPITWDAFNENGRVAP